MPTGQVVHKHNETVNSEHSETVLAVVTHGHTRQLPRGPTILGAPCCSIVHNSFGRVNNYLSPHWKGLGFKSIL